MSRKQINKTIKKNKKKFTRRKRNMKHVNKMQSRKRRGGNNRTKRGGVRKVWGSNNKGKEIEMTVLKKKNVNEETEYDKLNKVYFPWCSYCFFYYV